MNKKIMMLLLGLSLSFHVHAVSCFITLVKDSCWTNYNVSMNVMNAATAKPLITIAVLQGKSWTRQEFPCQPSDSLSMIATFSPQFWENDPVKQYPTQRDWQLPATVAPGDTMWNITLCYSKDFSAVPLPPDADGNCKCNLADIPPLKP